jgi:hypothetical protein
MSKDQIKATLTGRSPLNIADTGQVRLGGALPSLPPDIRTLASSVDSGKVRLGGASPSLPPVRILPSNVADAGRVRLGGAGPAI